MLQLNDSDETRSILLSEIGAVDWEKEMKRCGPGESLTSPYDFSETTSQLWHRGLLTGWWSVRRVGCIVLLVRDK